MRKNEKVESEILYKGNVVSIDEVEALMDGYNVVWNNKLQEMAALIIGKTTINPIDLAKVFSEFVSALQEWIEALNYLTKVTNYLNKEYEIRKKVGLECFKDDLNLCCHCGNKARHTHDINGWRSFRGNTSLRQLPPPKTIS